MNIFVKLRLWLAQKMRRRGVFYINGPELLPAPLSQESEAECLLHMDDEAVRSRLVEHNLRLVAHIIKKYYTTKDNIFCFSIELIFSPRNSFGF